MIPDGSEAAKDFLLFAVPLSTAGPVPAIISLADYVFQLRYSNERRIYRMSRWIYP
jgi:hypothetical protein